MNTQLILHFLSELEQNNHKEWMDTHRDWYLQAKDEFLNLVHYLLAEMTDVDEGLLGLQPKDCIFRINRDIRFSKNKSPYKNNFGVFMAEGGKKSPNAGYYLHVQPGDESFIGGGMYHPESEALGKVRQEIDYNAAELKQITDQGDFRQYFGAIQGEKLKRAPKGYEPDHPNIELLKLKDFVVMHKLSDEELKDENFKNRAVEIFRTMAPFIHYLNVAIS